MATNVEAAHHTLTQELRPRSRQELIRDVEQERRD